MLVVGIRGSGKSFWWSSLLDPDIRSVVPFLGGNIEVKGGFGQGSNQDWPDRDELRKLQDGERRQPRLIWKTVVLRQVARTEMPRDWEGAVDWVSREPSKVAAALREADERLRRESKKHLAVFDALDTTADSPFTRSVLLRGLLELVVELRAFSSIRAKAFVRPDMLDDPKVKNFTDASKAIASAVSLDWTTEDLYGLLFQYLANGSNDEASAAFREMTVEKWEHNALAWWRVPDGLRNSVVQERVFTQIAGPWMGTDRRRGKTYTWVPNHLADAYGKVSPRSVLAAIRRAAAHKVPDDHGYTLHWKGLQDGVRSASEWRVREIDDDFRWAGSAMKMLSNIVVPCDSSVLMSAWKRGQLVSLLDSEAQERGLDGVLEDLRRVGILQVLRDDRINIPDVYRVGFGLRRKGGFSPRG
jgi:hypothetical protein